MPQPLLSLIIPTRNRWDLLERALESIPSSLPVPFEVIVSDNASDIPNDELKIRYPHFRFVRQESLLPMAAHWNHCLLLAKGKYLKLLCDDDLLLPGGLERELELLKDPQIALVASARQEVAADGKTLVSLKGPREDKIFQSQELFCKMVIEENFLGPPSAVMFLRAHFCGFPIQYNYACDWAAWILMGTMGAIAINKEPSSAFRLHQGNLTHQAVREGLDFVEVMALRRECLSKIRGPKAFFVFFVYKIIFIYRLSRRILKLGMAGEPIPPFLRRVFWETREPLAQNPLFGKE